MNKQTKKETNQLVDKIMSAKIDTSNLQIHPDGIPNAAMENLRKEMDEKGGTERVLWTLRVPISSVQHFGHLCGICDVQTPKDIETFMLYIMQLGLNKMLQEEAYIYNKCLKHFAASQQANVATDKISVLPSDANATETDVEKPKKDKNSKVD